MNLERYPVRSYDGKKHFEFISKVPKGKIKKVVLFQELSTEFYNLGFGDWEKKKKTIDSQIRSNNGDRDKILATVAYCVVEFFNYTEDAIIIIAGQTNARKRFCSKQKT